MNALEAASLVMIPSGYENGTLGSLKPLDGTGDFTFSRGSDISATRVNEDGYIEKGRENLLTYSNDFSQSAWLKLNGASVVGKTATDPFGVVNNAWVVTFDGTSNGRIEQTMANMLKTSSLYARMQNGTQDVQIGNKTSGIPIFTLTTEWQRIEAFSSDGGNPRLRCDDAATIEIFGFQSEQSLVATDYIETTTAPVAGGILEDMPRLDYSGSCPALLLEPQRTNLITHSEYRSGGYQASVVNNSILSPEGVSNGCLFIENTALNAHGIQFSNTISTNANPVNYTISVFAKAKERTAIQLSFYADSITNNSSFFDISNGTTTGDSDTHKIQDYGNGWYRCSFTASVLNSTGGYNLVRFMMSKIVSGNFSGYYTGDGVSGLYMWGLQVEQDATYPTSYIPTYGTSQTRLADDAIAAVTNTTSRTYFLDGKRLADEDYQNSAPFFYSPSDNLSITFWNSNRFRFRFGGAINSYYTLVGDDFKIAISYDGTDSKVFVNGVYFTTQTFDLGNLTSIVIRGAVGAVSYNQTLLFPTALSDDECIELTTI